MVWRIARSIVRGELDNRTQGLVLGTVWLLGAPQPVRFKLEGNCHRDIAGSLIRFSNPEPVEDPDAVSMISPLQKGMVGDITASRRVSLVPERNEGEKWDQYIARARQGRRLGNALYIEWISNANGRVLIESADFEVIVEDTQWRMTHEQHDKQCRANRLALHEWLESMADAMDEEVEEVDPLIAAGDEQPMDEFEWEQFLREADARAEKYMGLVEKYTDHPDSERMVAREMGWTWMEDAETTELVSADDVFEDAEEGWEDELEPNPVTEGVDWVRSADGHIEHPLTVRMHDISLRMWQYCRGKGLIDDGAEQTELHEMLFEMQTTSAKIAGALDGLAYDESPEGGFVVACLKRALVHLHNSIAASGRVARMDLLEAVALDGFRTGLFAVREEILRLMNRYRHEEL